MKPTADPYVLIEEERIGYVRYRQLFPATGEVVRRWEVHGECDHRGDCIMGMNLPDGGVVETLEQAHSLATAYTGPDVPVTPEFDQCCAAAGLLSFVELPVGD